LPDDGKQTYFCSTLVAKPDLSSCRHLMSPKFSVARSRSGTRTGILRPPPVRRSAHLPAD
jgi:hypothetical protein